MDNQGPLISGKALDRAKKLFGKPAVVLALSHIADIQRINPAGRSSPRRILHQFTAGKDMWNDKFSRGSLKVIEALLQDSPETEAEEARLLAEINGVSELATVPLQTPKARITPGVEEDGKVSHQTF